MEGTLDTGGRGAVKSPCRLVDKITQTHALQDPVANSTSSTRASTSYLDFSTISFMEESKLSELANLAFLELATRNGIDNNPADFATLAVKGMKTLKNHNKGNLIYKWAMCIAKTRPSTGQSLFPLDRMPFGLVEFQIEFFSSTNIMAISVPDDYQTWYETMCAKFPSRFSRLFRGPMWSGLPPNLQKDPLTARPNVAAPSIRTVQKNNASSAFSDKSEIQIEALKQLKVSNPKGRFWIKVDAFDIKVALQESVKGQWNGDIDLGDQRVALLHQEYQQRKSLCKASDHLSSKDHLMTRLQKLLDCLHLDVTFLADGLVAAEDAYTKKFNAPNTSQELLKALCWERVEFNSLLQQAQCFIEKYETMKACLCQQAPREKDVVTALQNVEHDSLTYLRNLFIKKRQPGATHILLFLVSDERRNKKPYALPVQYIPYKSIKDQYVRDMTDAIKSKMMEMDLKPVGAVSDGEFNSLRTQGSTRPLHIWQIIHDAKESVSRQSEQTLISMLKKTGGPCRNLIFPSFLFFAEKRLLNHSITTLPVQNLDECELRCYREHNCVSINFEYKTHASGKYICELNNSTHEEHDGDLVKAENYFYRGTKNACSNSPCKNNGTCHSGFTKKGYKCLCTSGWTGEQCQYDIDECQEQRYKCGKNAICTNTDGSYACTCDIGFYGDGYNCTECETIFDFEDHDLSNWTLEGTAFKNQPTYGPNPSNRSGNYLTNHKGDWWIGTYENRSSPSHPVDIQGDEPQGSGTSPTFVITGKLLKFLIGAGCCKNKQNVCREVRAELIVEGNVITTEKPKVCNEAMSEKSWNVLDYAGKQAQLRLIDNSSGGWGHINFDHLQVCHRINQSTNPNPRV